MSKYVLLEVPRYLVKGKGYSLDPNEMFMAGENSVRGFEYHAAAFAVAGDYHNGPLSVLIPFGLWGATAFTWFLVAASRMLYRNCIHGDPALKCINQMLFACFIEKAIFFVLFFGSIYSGLAEFTGLEGISVSLNGESKKRA